MNTQKEIKKLRDQLKLACLNCGSIYTIKDVEMPLKLEFLNQIIKEIEEMQNEEYRDGDFIDATEEVVKLIKEKYMEGGNEL